MAAITLGISEDVSILNASLQLVTVGQLQEIVNQLIENNIIFKSCINRIGAAKIKLLSIKQFIEERLKLRGFLIQMHFKIT